jgi:Ethanolamine utilization protein EutJ (predicted chaperonin)
MEEAAQISSGINRMVTPSAPAKLAAGKTAAKDTKAKVSYGVGDVRYVWYDVVENGMVSTDVMVWHRVVRYGMVWHMI